MDSGSMRPPGAGVRLLAAAAALLTAAAAQAEDTTPPESAPGQREWSGRTDRSEITLRAELEHTAGPHAHRALAEYIYGKQNGAKSSDRYGGSFRWRYELNELFYAQSLTSFEADRIRRIRERTEQNLSLGYRFLGTDRLEGSLAPGATAQYNREADLETEMNYLVTVSQEFSRQLTDAHHFREDGTLLYNPEDSRDYSYRLNASLAADVTRSVDLSFRYRFLYENQVAPGVERAEHRILAALGYSF